MNILFITNLYPANNPLFGVFVKEQIVDIAKTVQCHCDVYFLNAKEKGNYKYLVSFFSIPKKIRQGNYDVIHIHYGLTGLFLLFYKPAAKVFLTLHGGDILPKQGKLIQIFLVRKILKKINKVFILSEEMEKEIKLLKLNYEILPCGVNTDFFKPLYYKKAEGVKLILFPADPSRRVKNYRLFKNVIELLIKKSNFKIKEQSIHNLSREGVRDLMNAADCLLMTSFSEGSPQVVKEALACGLPVVSVSVGDVSFVIDGIPGCYVSKGYSKDELALLILKSFKANRDVIRNIFTEKGFYNSKNISKRIVENYKKILAKE